jgi:S1-C subfamily serine protease
VRVHGEGLGDGPLEILDVADGSPASGRLQVGDVLRDVANVPRPRKPYVYGDKALLQRISAFDAGEKAQLVIRRNGAELTVPVELGTMKDAKTMLIPQDEDRVVAL